MLTAHRLNYTTFSSIRNKEGILRRVDFCVQARTLLYEYWREYVCHFFSGCNIVFVLIVNEFIVFMEHFGKPLIKSNR